MARAAHTPLARLLVMIAAACAGVSGVITALGATVVSVVDSVAEANSRRSNVIIERRLTDIETRVNGRFGLDLEEQTRRAKDDELAEAIDALRLEVRSTRRRATP
jgi:hypothetical protein